MFLICICFFVVFRFEGFYVLLVSWLIFFVFCKNILRILDFTEFVITNKHQKLKIECSKCSSPALKNGAFDSAIYSPKRQVNVEYLY